jgi:flagellar L-ring protein precursor FlgH
MRLKKMKYNILLTLIIAIVFGGCAARTVDPEINFEPPKYVEQLPGKVTQEDVHNMGSIFGQGENPLFSDHKAMHVNDIVKVVISENSTSSNSAQKSMAESDEVALGAGLFAGAQAGPVGAYNAINPSTNATFSANSASTYSGKGATQHAASFSTTISARIVKVLQNGNYFISGSREIMVNNEKQRIQISGVVRPYDINQENQIDSSQVADAKILYDTQGDMDKSTQQGWGTKIVESVWPF